MKKLGLALFMMALACCMSACASFGGASSEQSSVAGSSELPQTSNSQNDNASDSEETHQHQYVKVEAKEENCAEEGNVEYWACSECELIFNDEQGTEQLSWEDVAIAKTPHEAIFRAAKDSTCFKEGNSSYWVCINCKAYFEDKDCQVAITDKNSVIIPQKVHTIVHVPATEPNGANNGNIEYWTCDNCTQYYTDAEGKEQIAFEDTVILSVLGIPDFIVNVPVGKDPVVVHISDTQIIDAAQTRPGRDGVYTDLWATDQVEERCYDYLTELFTATKPDLIILTGDVVYGEFDDNGTALVSFINFMESFKIYWAPVFGNHDNESYKGVDWQCEQFENAEYCLFEQKNLTGNGNYSVGIAQGGELKRVFYMMDSNGCTGASAESVAGGQMRLAAGFGQDQIDWYTEQITAIKEVSPETKISFAYHIQQAIFGKAYEKYGFNQSVKEQNINIDTHFQKADTDFGYIGKQMKYQWDTDYKIFAGMKKLGVDSIFVGHEHCNSSSVVYEGIRFQYAQKSSEYDRYNVIDKQGNISGGYAPKGTSLVGGTVLPLSENDGSIQNPYIYYCGFENGQIDWESYKEKPAIMVNGLQYGGVNNKTANLYADGAVTAEAVTFNGVNAYAVTANTQGKLYVNTNLLRGKTTFTFTVYIENIVARMSGLGPFSLRIKPDNDCAKNITGVISLSGKQYLDYDIDSVEGAKLKLNEWQTFTVDISDIAEQCSEFAYNIATGNTIYLRDLAVS